MFDEQDTSGDLGGNRWEQLSPQTWRTVLELLPRGITIRMTVSEGLISLFNGMLEIMENRFVNASGRASRRYIRAHGQPRFALLQLTETRLSGLSAVTHNLKIRDLYNEFVSLLVEYEGLVAASGELEGTLSLNELCIDLDTSRARSSYIYQLAPRLFNVTTSQLKLNGKLYSPLQQKTFNRMRDKSNRDMLRILGGSDSEDEP
ncbi:hypothetical protein BT96DRAFT_218877 [Gymnopus androsaceus JB14]|uniref:Uncharacterized protein n=1 Tax=Gymnopus androsaceus JB14 TaxID=1447944 RepID=A0A6A4H5G9_9AGAR|nr:hypothetical protein BT96DRAFT_218877 [Gymnopus androsaceus JB14]